MMSEVLEKIRREKTELRRLEAKLLAEYKKGHEYLAPAIHSIKDRIHELTLLEARMVRVAKIT